VRGAGLEPARLAAADFKSLEIAPANIDRHRRAEIHTKRINDLALRRIDKPR